jgi:hypothetical protein
MFSKILPLFVLFSLVLAACGAQEPGPVVIQATPYTPKALPTDAYVMPASLTEATVELSLTEAIETSCGCQIMNFTDMAVIWLRDGEAVVFKNLLGFKMAATVVLPAAQPGDTVIYGPVKDALAYARGGLALYDPDPLAVLEVSGDCDFRDGDRIDYVMVSGGQAYDQAVLYWQVGAYDPWQIKLSNNVVVEAAVFNALMLEGNTATQAENELINSMEDQIQASN